MTLRGISQNRTRPSDQDEARSYSKRQALYFSDSRAAVAKATELRREKNLRERELEILEMILDDMARLERKGVRLTRTNCLAKIHRYDRLVHRFYLHSELVAMARGLACSIRHHRLGGELWR